MIGLSAIGAMDALACLGNLTAESLKDNGQACTMRCQAVHVSHLSGSYKVVEAEPGCVFDWHSTPYFLQSSSAESEQCS